MSQRRRSAAFMAAVGLLIAMSGLLLTTQGRDQSLGWLEVGWGLAMCVCGLFVCSRPDEP